MKQIPLSRGLFAKVSDEDYEWISQWKWCAGSGIYTRYAVRGRRPQLQMHRVIMRRTRGDGLRIDHINGDTLDNRRENLRFVTTSQNAMNQRKNSRNTSGFKGVTLHKRTGKWQAGITQNKKFFHLGLFADPVAAHMAYREAAQERFGEFANFGGAL